MEKLAEFKEALLKNKVSLILVKWKETGGERIQSHHFKLIYQNEKGEFLDSPKELINKITDRKNKQNKIIKFGVGYDKGAFIEMDIKNFFEIKENWKIHLNRFYNKNEFLASQESLKSLAF